MKSIVERPILFSAEMVRAILDGRKTQTRRVMKVQPWPDATVEVGPYHPHWIDRNGESQPGPSTFGAVWDHQDIVNGGDAGLRCPYGAPGDTLWVREAWASPCSTRELRDGVTACGITYRTGHEEAPGAGPRVDVKWRPSIHMPRWASRITLRITDIRVERLQDISEDDAKAEGVKPLDYAAHHVAAGCGARIAFEQIWTTINGSGAWEANPWVWVVSFERVKP
jgi:hypothetical protein